MPKFIRPGFSMNYRIVDGLLPEDTLFLHGNLSANLWWEPAVKEWQKQDGGPGRAIFAEWRGCGESRDFEGGLDLVTLADDCHQLLDYLSLDRVNVVGHSTGGLIALHAMAQAPKRFKRAFLLDPVTPEGLELPPEIAGAFQRMSEDFAFCEAVILSTIYGGNLSPHFKKRIAEAAFGVSPKVWLGVPQMLTVPCPIRLEGISQPVMVAHGERDAVLPIEKSEALAAQLPHGKFFKIEGRGHCTNVEDAELFVSLVNEFFFARPAFGSKTKLVPESAYA